jgi:putative endonuclease
MQTVYVLYSNKYDKLYIGRTSNLLARFHSHNTFGSKGYTKKYRPWMVIHTEVFDNLQEANKREKQLKGGQGRAWIRTEILPYFL